MLRYLVGCACVLVSVMFLLGCDGGNDGDGGGGGTAGTGGSGGTAGIGGSGGTPGIGGSGGSAGSGGTVKACSDTVQVKQAQFAAELASWSIADATEMVRTGGDQALEADYAGRYRDDLATHPGCVSRSAYDANSEPFSNDNEADVPSGSSAVIAGYPCAAKAYDQASEDTSKPIIILVHGNSSGVTSFEEYFNAALAGTEVSTGAGFTFTVDSSTREQLAAKLIAAGYRVIGYDGRVDLVTTLTDWDADAATGNPFLSIDHGWNVPMVQRLLKSVMSNNPTRKVSIVAFSLGATSARDALRRLYNEHKASAEGAVNPFAQLQDVILLSGAHHGISSYPTCGTFSHMRGTVSCELGDRAAFEPTYFTQPINGPGDLFSTPCADGSFAFGEGDQCEDNVVTYTTVTMRDVAEGVYQDEFVSESSSGLDMPGCVTNELIGLEDFDASGYFFTSAPGFFANHFGAARSDAAMQIILDKLAD